MKTTSEEAVMIDKLPSVGATAWSRFLPSVAEVVVEWRFSDRHRESRRKGSLACALSQALANEKKLA